MTATITVWNLATGIAFTIRTENVGHKVNVDNFFS
jgi:hypothetical protein